MYVNYKKVKDFLILCFLVVQNFIEPEFFFILSLFFLIFLIIRSKSFSLKAILIKLNFLILIFFSSIISTIVNLNQLLLVNILRDFFYYMNPIIFILIGYFVSLNYSTSERVLVVFIKYSIVSSILSFLSFSFSPTFDMNTLRVHFNYFNLNALIGFFALFELRNKLKINIHLVYFLLLLLSLSTLLTFSRTMYLVFFVCFVLFVFRKANFKKILGFSLSFSLVTGFVVFFIYSSQPYYFNEIIMKTMRSLVEINPTLEWNSFNIVNNWRGFENYSAINEISTYNFFELIFGKGFGHEIYVGKLSYLVNINSTGYIFFLHNGYLNIIVKSGFLSFISFILFNLFILFQTKYKNFRKKIIEIEIFRIFIIILPLITLVVTGIFSPNSYLVFCILIGIVPLRRLNS